MRREIWEAAEAGAGSSRRLHRTTSAATSGQDQLASMSVADLNKRFINTFLYLQVVITTSPCVCQLITPWYPGQALHPDRHRGLPRGAEQPAGPVPGAHKQVPAPALHRQAGAGGGWKIFDNVLKIFPFVQIMALNMFSIEETKLRSGSSSATTPTTYRSVAQVPVITNNI